MKRVFPVLAGIFLLVSGAFAQATFGEIEYVEGDVSLCRGVKSLGDLNIGDEILVDDFIKTGPDGVAVVTLNKTTGMRGSLTIKARSAVYLRVTQSAAGPKTTLELVAGQIGSKVSKLSGSPTLQVRTDSTVMGVRGTEFGVSTSVSGNVLIYCSEGTVEASDGETTLPVPKGEAVEKRTDERLSRIPVTVSSPEDFANRWITQEIEAFRANPARVVASYEKKYSDLDARFSVALDKLQKSAALSKWMDEDRRGALVNPRSPETMREKKELMGNIIEIRKILFIFERIYYRLDEADALVAGTDAERTELRPGLTVGAFLKQFRDEREKLGRMMIFYRNAERLYTLRNEGGAGFPGLGEDDDSFFGSSDF
jgi:hypothetical protein